MKPFICLLMMSFWCSLLLTAQSTNSHLSTSSIAATRYLSNGSAFQLRRGQAYYRNSQLLLNQVDAGITDNWSIGTGVIPAFIFSSPTPVWVSSKVSTTLLSDNIRVAASGAIGTSIGEVDSWSTLAQGLVTFGHSDQHFTVNVGQANIDDLIQTTFINFSGSTRLVKSYYLLTENYILIDEEQPTVMASLGGRWIGQKIIFDIGVFGELDEGRLGVLPWVNLTFPFNLPKNLKISTNNTDE
jgi:hypothetical protein